MHIHEFGGGEFCLYTFLTRTARVLQFSLAILVLLWIDCSR